MKQTDIIISGGGIAGLTCALLLAQAGLRIALIEPHPPEAKPKPNGRTVALMERSLNIVRACEGVWDMVKEAACPMERMRIVDISRSVKEPLEIEFPASDIGMAQFGYNIPNDLLRGALYAQAKKHKGITLHESALADYEARDTHVLATLEDGLELKAALIAGADGRGSKVREIAGIDVVRKEYDQAAVTCLINHSRAHENTSTEFHKPDGPLALVPLAGNQSSVVWVESKARAEELVSLKKSAFEQALMDKTHEILGGITLEAGPVSWPLCTMKAKALTAKRCALVAEAAHVMSPITAQGLNLSLRDVAALAESIVDHARLGQDVGSGAVLRAYEKRRRLDIETRVFGVDGMNHLVSHRHKVIKDMRRIGLKTLETVPAFKTLSMQLGLAPQADEGRLARGEGL